MASVYGERLVGFNLTDDDAGYQEMNIATVFKAQEVPNYSSEWFDNNKTKPLLKRFVSSVSYANVSKMMSNCIQVMKIDLETAKVFLSYFMDQMTDTLVTKWESFDQTIGNPNDRISPWDLVLKTDHPITPSESVGASLGKELQRGYATFLFALIRISLVQKGAKDNYIREIRGRLETLLSTGQCGNLSLIVDKFQTSIELIGDNLDILGMAAAVDMFLNKFPSHPDNGLRFGTMVLRHDGCSALLSYSMLPTLFNMEFEDVMYYAFDKGLMKELMSIARGGQELQDLYSYFPYMLKLELTPRSPYSSTVNPRIHSWVHIMGCLLIQERSKNARATVEATMPAMAVIGAFTAYVMHRTESIGLFKGTREEMKSERTAKRQALDNGEEESEQAEDMPKRDHLSIYKWILEHKGRLPRSVRKFARTQASKLKDIRDGTFGA